MFWKKKKEETSQEVKQDEIVYDCVAVNYDYQVECEEGEDFDEVKENFILYVKEKNLYFKRENINKITERIGYNYWDAFVWIDRKITNSKNRTSTSTSKWRWTGISDDVPSEERDEHYKLFSEHLNHKTFYTMTEIMSICSIVGMDVEGRSNWTQFQEITDEYNDYNLSITYLQNSNLTKKFLKFSLSNL